MTDGTPLEFNSSFDPMRCDGCTRLRRCTRPCVALGDIFAEIAKNKDAGRKTWVNQDWVDVFLRMFCPDLLRRHGVRILPPGTVTPYEVFPNKWLCILGLQDFKDYGTPAGFLYWDKEPDYPEIYEHNGRQYDLTYVWAGGRTVWFYRERTVVKKDVKGRQE